MRKRERKLRAAIGGHAKAKESARRKAAVAEAKAKKHGRRVRKLKQRLAAENREHAQTVAKLEREIKIDELRAMHAINVWRKKAETASDQLADLRLKHVKRKGRDRIRRAKRKGRT